MFKRLEEIIKKVKGNVLTIGLDESLLNSFKNNNMVNLYSISNENAHRGIFSRKKNKKKTNKGKEINIKKLRKKLKKKSIDYLFLNIESMYKYYKYIIKDTIYLNNNKVYVYSSNNIDKDFIISRYKRYNVEIKVTDYKNGFILEIDNKNGKTNFIKDRLNIIKDTFYNVAEFVGNILAS